MDFGAHLSKQTVKYAALRLRFCIFFKFIAFWKKFWSLNGDLSIKKYEELYIYIFFFNFFLVLVCFKLKNNYMFPPNVLSKFGSVIFFQKSCMLIHVLQIRTVQSGWAVHRENLRFG